MEDIFKHRLLAKVHVVMQKIEFLKMSKKVLLSFSLFYFACLGVVLSQNNKLFLTAPEVINLPSKSERYDIGNRKNGVCNRLP
jgi:hypothetical protein